MALYVRATAPADLLKAIKKGIDDNKIDTWEYDSDGDFTHTPPQWRKKAWLRPTIGAGQLTFGIIKPAKEAISTEVYAVYHGRFIEMLLAHFDLQFSTAQATAQPVIPPDIVK